MRDEEMDVDAFLMLEYDDLEDLSGKILCTTVVSEGPIRTSSPAENAENVMLCLQTPRVTVMNRVRLRPLRVRVMLAVTYPHPAH